MDQKEALLSAAFPLFLHRSMAEVGITEICQAGGITKPTLYYWFGNKEGFLEALVDWIGQPWLAALARGLEYRGDMIMATRAAFREVFAYASAHPEAYRWFRVGMDLPGESQGAVAFAAWAEREYGLYREFFVQAAAHHGNMRGKEDYLALSLPGVIHSHVTGAWLRGWPLDEARVIQGTQHFLYGVFS